MHDVGAEVAAVLRQAARAHLGIAEGEYWPSGVAEAQADALAPLIAERVEAAKAEALREAADDLLTFSRGTRDAWRNHNAGRDLGKQRQIRPDLNNWADATEAASHRIRNRAAALDPGPRP